MVEALDAGRHGMLLVLVSWYIIGLLPRYTTELDSWTWIPHVQPYSTYIRMDKMQCNRVWEMMIVAEQQMWKDKCCEKCWEKSQTLSALALYKSNVDNRNWTMGIGLFYCKSLHDNLTLHQLSIHHWRSTVISTNSEWRVRYRYHGHKTINLEEVGCVLPDYGMGNW